MSTPDPRTERAQLDKWLLQTNRYPGTVTAGEAAQHLYDAAVKANDALTTEAARVRGVVQNLRNDVAEKFSQARISFCHDAYGAQLEILRELLSKLEQDAGPFSATNEKGQSTWSTARPTVGGYYWWRFDQHCTPSICHIMVCRDGSLAEMSNSGIGHMLLEAQFTGEWCPIARPGEVG